MSIRGAGRNFVVRYALEQIVRFVALMFAVSFVVFALVSASPIDPVQMNVGQAAYMTMSEAKRAQLAEYWGVGTPLLERYANWLASVLQGDWGTSLRFNAPVMEVLGNRAANSLALLGIAWVASGVLGLLLGVVAGVNRDRWPAIASCLPRRRRFGWGLWPSWCFRYGWAGSLWAFRCRSENRQPM